jgi:hypothetical protein
LRAPLSDQFIDRSGAASFVHIDRCRCIDFYQYVGVLSSREAKPAIRPALRDYREEKRLKRRSNDRAYDGNAFCHPSLKSTDRKEDLAAERGASLGFGRLANPPSSPHPPTGRKTVSTISARESGDFVPTQHHSTERGQAMQHFV